MQRVARCSITPWTAGDYFQAMGIHVVRGRPFTTDETTSLPGRCGDQPVGGDPALAGAGPDRSPADAAGDSTWNTVVGVVGDVMQDGFRDTPQAVVYFPLVGPTPDAWRIGSPAYVPKTPRAETIAPEVRALVREVAARGADVPDLHHGWPGEGFDGAALLHHADAGRDLARWH